MNKNQKYEKQIKYLQEYWNRLNLIDGYTDGMFDIIWDDNFWEEVNKNE